MQFVFKLKFFFNCKLFYNFILHYTNCFFFLIVKYFIILHLAWLDNIKQMLNLNLYLINFFNFKFFNFKFFLNFNNKFKIFIIFQESFLPAVESTRINGSFQQTALGPDFSLPPEMLTDVRDMPGSPPQLLNQTYTVRRERAPENHTVLQLVDENHTVMGEETPHVQVSEVGMNTYIATPNEEEPQIEYVQPDVVNESSMADPPPNMNARPDVLT